MKIPTVEEAGAIAVCLSPELDVKEQSMFIAGFQEAIKYLHFTDNLKDLVFTCKKCQWEDDLGNFTPYYLYSRRTLFVCPKCGELN